ncbi:MAG TPA: hypothetical protein VNU97_13000 [Rhizomicrobium sp.]|jgi:hypothetical protein|nr:hypothetical protein [Rhizomicrobium sp.]
MRRLSFAAAIFALAAATATAADAAPMRIFRVDSVVAKTVRNHLVVTASGAVRSGGWTAPRLHETPHMPEAAVQIVEFLAAPPRSAAVVIQALLPVTATAVFPLPHYGTIKVTVVSETNSVSAPIQ